MNVLDWLFSATLAIVGFYRSAALYAVYGAFYVVGFLALMRVRADAPTWPEVETVGGA